MTINRTHESIQLMYIGVICIFHSTSLNENYLNKKIADTLNQGNVIPVTDSSNRRVRILHVNSLIYNHMSVLYGYE